MDNNPPLPQSNELVQQQILAPAASGAFFKMLYVERELKGFAITAAELRQLGNFNRIATVFFSLGGALVGYFLGLLWTVYTSPQDSPAVVMGKPLMVVAAVFALICYAVAFAITGTRRNEIKQIINESKASYAEKAVARRKGAGLRKLPDRAARVGVGP